MLCVAAPYNRWFAKLCRHVLHAARVCIIAALQSFPSQSQAVLEAGCVPAIVDAMNNHPKTHPDNSDVQGAGSLALGRITKLDAGQHADGVVHVGLSVATSIKSGSYSVTNLFLDPPVFHSQLIV